MTLRATRAEGPITIDGRMTEPDWERAEVARDFIQDEPDEGELTMKQTEVRILYDDENVYVGARLYDDPDQVYRQLTRRNVTGRAAGYLEFSFDPNFDRTTGYQFRVTAAGVQQDRYRYDDTRSDTSWDAVWESAVHHDEEGWMVEARIPLSQLRYDPSPEPQTWGLNLARRRIADNERSEWAWTPPGVSGGVSRFGRLEGVLLEEAPRTLELIPYAMGGLEVRDADPGDPFFTGRDNRQSVGADVRYGLGSTFVLDAAINPDFGQVQVDPRVVNLSAFPTFFPEQRPFFTRDDRIFDFSLSGPRNTLFHSRRIGRSPQASSMSGADFTTAPGETTILGAGKLTGRTQGGLSVGALAAVTDRETGRAYFAEEDRFERFTAEPGSRYGALRLQQDLRDAESRIGGLVTLTDRDLPGDGILDHLPSTAVSGGVDFEHTWSDRDWSLWGFAAGSHVQGSREAIEAIQRSPNHYYQRPDQDYLELDDTRTSLTGAEWRLQLDKQGGRHWTGAIWAAQRTPGFEVNDLGFSTATERLDAGARIQYREPTPGDILRNYRFSLSTFHNWRHSVLEDGFLSSSAWGEAHKAGNVNASANFTFLNWWSAGIDFGYSPEVLSDGLTRGGPLMVDPATRSLGLSFSTDRRDAIALNASVDYVDGMRGGQGFSADLSVDTRPSDRVAVSLGPTYERSTDPTQYVQTLSDDSFEPTYGDRYIFGDLRREELGIEAQVDVIFTPDLSLEIFAQPLISAGNFRDYKQLAAASTFDFVRFPNGEPVAQGGPPRCEGGQLCRDGSTVFLDYSGDGSVDAIFPEQNFNVRSLRGNAVLRWEFRPGSRLFLVWQQERSTRDRLGTFDVSRDMDDLLGASGEHVFMVKVDYWLDL